MRKVTVVKLDSKLVEEYRKVSRRLGWPMNHAIEHIMAGCLPNLESFLKTTLVINPKS